MFDRVPKLETALESQRTYSTDKCVARDSIQFSQEFLVRQPVRLV